MPSHNPISQSSLRADNTGISKAAALLQKDWKPIKNGKPGGKILGIYLIGLKILNYVIYLYLGRSNDVRRRLFEHMQPARKSKQKIDDFIQFKGIGGSRGWRQGRAPPPLGPNSFIFMQFSVKIWPNNRLAPPPWKLAPPRLGNPGSATERERRHYGEMDWRPRSEKCWRWISGLRWK